VASLSRVSDNGKVVTIQFAKFKHPSDERGRKALEAATNAYVETSARLQQAQPVEILYSGRFDGELFGDENGEQWWDGIYVMLWPCREAMLKGLWLNPECIKVVLVRKPLGLEKYKMILTGPEPE